MIEKIDQRQTVKVWDLPTRLFHWILVALVVTQWLTAENSSTMIYHEWGGYGVLILVVFRLLWGVVGSETARFSHFLRGPRSVIAYVKELMQGEKPFHLGHNPLGGWSILVMLGLLLIQAVTGLFANDDIASEGPLYSWVSKATSDWLTTIHLLNFNLLLLMIGVHLLAVLFYLLVKGENLIHPMLSGRKHLAPEPSVSAPYMVSSWLGLAVLAGVGLAVWLLLR